MEDNKNWVANEFLFLTRLFSNNTARTPVLNRGKVPKQDKNRFEGKWCSCASNRSVVRHTLSKLRFNPRHDLMHI